MKKSVINSILEKDIKRKDKIISLICLTVIVSVISVVFTLIYLEKSKIRYVTYREDGNVDYNVHLRENEFYEGEYIESNNQYITSLIDYIPANFKYKISLDSDKMDFRYSYRVDAEVNVVDSKTKKTLYKLTDNLVKNVENISTNSIAEINQKVDIDFNKYNELIKNFVSVYGLNGIQSTLNINMYVGVAGNCEKIEDNDAEPSVLSLVIPLTEKTIDLDITNDLVKSKNNVMVCDKPSPFVLVYRLISLVNAGIAIGIIVYLISYINKTRTPNTIYKKEIKRILNNYGSYIQKVGNNFNLDDYKLLEIEDFTDMLEIRDTLMQPILMIENEVYVSTYFVIPSNTNLLYIYRLDINNIQK